MASDYLFSIIIPAKNEEKNILPLLASIRCQTVVSSQVPIIVYDAHSTDRTRGLIEQFRQESGLNITVVDGDFPSIARNLGAKRAATPYVLFLDADVRLSNSDTLAKAFAIMQEREAHLVVTHIRCVPGNLADAIFWKCFSMMARWKLCGPVATGMFMLMRRDVFLQVGGFNESIMLGEDLDLARKIDRRRAQVADTYIYITNRRFKSDGYLMTVYRYIRLFFSNKYLYRDHRDYINRRLSD